MSTELHFQDDTNYLDMVSSKSYKCTVIQAAQVAKAMAQRAKADVDRLKAIDKEQAGISDRLTCAIRTLMMKKRPKRNVYGVPRRSFLGNK